MDNDKSIPQSIRFQPHVLALARRKAKWLGIKLPAYLSQLIVRDNKNGIPDGQ